MTTGGTELFSRGESFGGGGGEKYRSQQVIHTHQLYYVFYFIIV